MSAITRYARSASATLAAKALKSIISLTGSQADADAMQSRMLNSFVGVSFGDTALQLPFTNLVYVYACTRKLMSCIAQVPLKLYQGEKEITSGPIIDLFNSPNQHTTITQFVEGCIAYYFLNGEAIIVQNENKLRGVPGSMWFADPMTTTYQLNAAGTNIAYWQCSNGSTTVNVPPERIMHIKQFNPYHPIRGCSAISALRLTNEQMLGAQRYNRDFFKNGVAAGMHINLKNKPEDSWLAQFLAQLDNKHAVDGHGHRPLVTWGETTVTPGVSQADMEFLALLENGVTEVCAAMGVPKELIGASKSGPLGGNDNKERSRQMWRDTCLPAMKALESQIDRDLLRRYGQNIVARFDISTVPELQQILTDKIADAQKLWSMGTPLAECNRLLALELDETKIPGASTSFLPIGVIPYEQAIAEPEPYMPESSPASVQDAGKASTHANTKGAARAALWRNYVAGWQGLERKYDAKLRNWVMDLRRETLANLADAAAAGKGARRKMTDPSVNAIVFDLSKARGRVSRLSMPFIREGVNVGARQVRDLLGEAGAAFNVDTDQRVRTFLARRESQITEVAATIDRQVRAAAERVINQTIADAAVNGTVMTVAQAITEAQDEIGDALKAKFNAASGRALTIARTELGAAVSEARMDGFRACGVERVQWVTAGDEEVRDSHLACDGEVRVLGEAFSCGLETPNDASGDAENVINCRCVLVPADNGE